MIFNHVARELQKELNNQKLAGSYFIYKKLP
jgi:hypothetical protein